MNIPHIRLINQRLGASKLKTPKQVVAWMGAMQAQDYLMVKWAIANRLSNATDSFVEDAMVTGSIVRTHILRPTWHMVASEDLRWMLALTAPRLRTTILGYVKQLGMDCKILHKTNDIIIRSLEGNKHKTRQELSEIINRSGIEANSHHIAQMMAHAELEGIVCSGIPQGRFQTYALVDEWVSQSMKLSKDEALAKLARLYLRSHAPATLSDFGWWSGLSLTEARRAFEQLKNEFTPREFDGQTYWINSDLENSNSKNDLFLLSAFDEYLVSYKDRNAVLGAENYAEVITKNGIFRPTIVYQGQVIGTWKKFVDKDKKIKAEPHFFNKPSKITLDCFERASASYTSYFD